MVLPAGDNLGNHAATQALNLATYLLVGQTAAGGAAGTAGLRVDGAGQVGIGLLAPAAPLEVQAGPALTGTNTGTAPQLRLSRAGTSGTKWEASAELAVGTYAPGIEALSQLDFRLGQNSNAAADQTVLSLRGNGDVLVPGTLDLGFQTVTSFSTVSGNSRNELGINCPTGYYAVGGGGGHRDFNAAQSDIVVNYSGPDETTPATRWMVRLTNTSSSSRAVVMRCNCARIK